MALSLAHGFKCRRCTQGLCRHTHGFEIEDLIEYLISIIQSSEYAWNIAQN